MAASEDEPSDPRHRSRPGPRWGDSFHEDLHPDLKADYILANPPFNISDWGGEQLRDDARWTLRRPARRQRKLRLAPAHRPPSVAATASPASCSPTARFRRTSGEGAIRQRLVEADLVECIVSLPSQLFYSTQIAASLWFVTRNKRARVGKNGLTYGDRSGRTLFIDVRYRGVMMDRTHRELTDEDIEHIASAYRSWRRRDGSYHDVPGFCREATIDEIRRHRYALVPGRYVGFAQQPSASPADRSKLLSDLHEIEEQVEKVGSLARSAIATLREVLHG